MFFGEEDDGDYLSGSETNSLAGDSGGRGGGGGGTRGGKGGGGSGVGSRGSSTNNKEKGSKGHSRGGDGSVLHTSASASRLPTATAIAADLSINHNNNNNAATLSFYETAPTVNSLGIASPAPSTAASSSLAARSSAMTTTGTVATTAAAAATGGGGSGGGEIWEEMIGIMAMVKNCPHLEVLDLSGCFRLNKVIGYGISTLTSLRILDVHGCNQITSSQFLQVAPYCTLLEEINLNDCGKGVTNEVLCLFSSRCHRMKKLSLARCLEVKSLGIKAIAQSMRYLEVLSLQGCRQLTDSMLVHLSQMEKVPLLIDLDLSGNPLLTDSILAWIAMKGHSLLTLAMKGTKVTQKALSSVRDRFPNCELVYSTMEFVGFTPKNRIADRQIINSYAKVITGITKIQARVRKSIAIKRVANLQEFIRRMMAHRLLQRLARGYLGRCRIRHLRHQQAVYHKAAVSITSIFRIAVAKKVILRLLRARYQKFLRKMVMKIQLLWRCYRDQQRLVMLKAFQRKRHHRRVMATIIIQSIGRMYLANIRVYRIKELKKMQYKVLNLKALLIQRVYRGFLARLEVKAIKQIATLALEERLTAVRKIQQVYRNHRTQLLVHNKTLEKQRISKAIVTIQAAMRGALARLSVMEMRYERKIILRKLAVLKIQCVYRMFIAKRVFLAMIKERYQLKLRREKAAQVMIQASRRKLAFIRYKRVYIAYIQRLTEEANRDIAAATKIQALMRRYKGRCIYFTKLLTKKNQWKELYDEEKSKRFFYNKLTGEIRWRIPQDLLDLIPHPTCDDCRGQEAILECKICNELFCGNCFTAVHKGGRRKDHEYRALYDFYGKRLDYGDGTEGDGSGHSGEYPCQWPSEVIQDEIQGWMLRVAPFRQPTRIYKENGWEEYNEEKMNAAEEEKRRKKGKAATPKSLLGKALEQQRVQMSMGKQAPKIFYFNRKTFETSYDLPEEVKQIEEEKQQQLLIKQQQQEQQQQQQQYSANAYLTGGGGGAGAGGYDNNNQLLNYAATSNSYNNTPYVASLQSSSMKSSQQQQQLSQGGGSAEDYSQLGYYDQEGNWIWYAQQQDQQEQQGQQQQYQQQQSTPASYAFLPYDTMNQRQQQYQQQQYQQQGTPDSNAAVYYSGSGDQQQQQRTSSTTTSSSRQAFIGNNSNSSQPRYMISNPQQASSGGNNAYTTGEMREYAFNNNNNNTNGGIAYNTNGSGANFTEVSSDEGSNGGRGGGEEEEDDEEYEEDDR